ncbi:MAG: DUF4336 domain-containing protein [Spirulinaceae cyanobacterium SM2_1_0]|nr:DUF4336 domain-containing protein [Spirulinaceae cyanobacterium SM2_1_0]
MPTLRAVDTDLWVAEQPLRYLGLEVGTRMTVVRLATGELALISAIALDASLQSQLDTLGTVRYIIAPNSFHYRFAADCRARYPEAEFLAAPGLRAKKPELAIDRELKTGEVIGEALECSAFAGVNVLTPNGIAALNEYIFFHRISRTLILTDTAFYFDSSFPLLTQFAGRLLGSYQQLRPSILEKLASREKEQIRAAVERAIAWDFQRVIVAHGNIVEQTAKQQFVAGYEWLLVPLRGVLNFEF